jgi:mono/diheme cytochrome c family protein
MSSIDAGKSLDRRRETVHLDRTGKDIAMRHALKGLTLTLPLLLLLGAVTAGQEDSGGKKRAGTGPANPISGKQLYTSYCSMCHGSDAKGGGPYSPQLKVWPPDLTLLARKNNGVYPSLHLAEVIGGEFDKPSHGSREMPVWGPVFRSMAHGRQDSAQRRIDNLVKYIETLQQK